MELSVGMYVRTDNGDITKICSIWENERVFFENKVDIGYLSSDSFGIGFLNKCKASHNIIDLIEVGDYVNGEKVFEVLIDRNMSRVKTELSTFFESDIKSIVTKQQFLQMEYKVGE